MKPFKADYLPLNDIDWEPLIPLIGRANRAIAQYNGALHAIPNPRVLLAPLTLQEAVQSSKIEGTQATLEDVFRVDGGEKPRSVQVANDFAEIVNYVKALKHAEQVLIDKPFHLNMLLEMHSILMDSVRGQDKARGRFRTDQNWIGPAGSTIDEAYFVPPSALDMHGLLDNWERYYHDIDRPDPLVQMAVIHAQFEIIHPFKDGNGRIGRLIIPLFLFERKILEGPIFYLSGWLESNRKDYIRHLRELGVEPGAWNRWITFFLTGLEHEALRNTETVRAISALYERLKKQVLDLTHSQYAVPLLDQMFKKPVFESSQLDFGERVPSRPAVANLLRAVKDAGILKALREGKGRRATLYVFPELINLCEGKEVF